MKAKHYCLLLFAIIIPGIGLAQTKESIRETVASEYFEKLYSKTYYSLLDRMDEDGYLPESLTGAYAGMFPRTTGAFALMLIETERYDEAEANINYVLKAILENEMERVPRVIGKDNGKPTILDDQHQIDGQAHVILAWSRLAKKRGITQFETDTWPVVRDLMKRTCDRTFFQYGGWSIEPELIRNIALEHSKESRMWDVWDLLTQSFIGAAMTDMAVIAQRHNDSDFSSDPYRRLDILKEGVQNNLTTTHYGKQIYAEMRIPNGDAGEIYPGLGWVTLSPVAAGWEGAGRQVLKNTVQVMREKLLKQSNGVTWMPTDGYPDGRFSNEVIGKGMGWEIDFANTEKDYKRLEEILHLLETVNAKKPIYMEGAWLEGNGIGLSNIISNADLEKMKTSVWRVKDAGNGEQTAWWCWAMARLRKSLGLPAEPARIEKPVNLISVSEKSGWGKRIMNIHSSSGWADDSENAYNLFLGEDNVGSRSDKWFATNTENPWVIFSLTDIYNIEKFEFRDGRWFEKEEGVTNVDEYSVYVSTTGTEDSDWTEIINEKGVADQEIKSYTLDTPAEARYIKFVLKGGGDTGKKIWIYGVDIYGTLSKKIDREDLISVGVPIVSDGSHYSIRETPANLVDGMAETSSPWATHKNDQGASAWVIFDMEEECEISKFALIDSEDWTTGYNVYVSNENLPQDDSGWIGVANETFDKTLKRKEIVLEPQVKARYVKLEIPAARQFGWTRIREFEIYGKKHTVGIDRDFVENFNLIVIPNPVTQERKIQVNGAGMLSIYSMQGTLLLQHSVHENETISLNNLSEGNYLLQLKKEDGKDYSTKVIVQ